MSIRGKKEGFFRLLGSFLILLSLILSIFFNFLALNNLLLCLVSIVIIIPPFLMSILLKLEQDFIVKNSKKFLFLLTTAVAILNLITLPFYDMIVIVRFVLIESSDLLLISCWHFSLSLYKRNKIIFLISGISYLILDILFWLSLQHLFLIGLLLMLILIFGLFLIIVAELLMKKKGWLKYI
jgi:hypothetical protein